MRRTWPLCLLLSSACIEEHPDWLDAGTQDAGSGESDSLTTDSGDGDSTADGSTSTSTTGDGDGGGDGDGDGGTTGSSDEHVIFATSGNWTGTFGSLTQADVHCQDFADQASLGGTWKALISDSSENAVDRISINGPVRNRMGDLVAISAEELWNTTIETGVLYSEWGGVITTPAWTGSDATGQYITGRACDDWTAAGPGSSGIVGDPTAVNLTWVQSANHNCQNDSRGLYCVSQ